MFKVSRKVARTNQISPLQPEKRATEAFQVGRRIFEDFDCLPATFRDTLDAPIQLQNESRNHLQIGAELSPETASKREQK